jgi:CBS domain-containing protein
MSVSEFEEAYEADESKIRGAILGEPISGIARRKPVVVTPGTSVLEAIRLMNERSRGCVLVVENNRLAGIFSERDVLRLAGSGRPFDGVEVGQVMTREPEVLRPEHGIAVALNMMSEGGYRHIPLVDADGGPVGLVAMRDIVAFAVSLFPDAVMTVPPDPSQIQSKYGG